MSVDNQDFVNRYTSAQVCAAAGISGDTLKNWVSRQPQVVLLNQGERDQIASGGGLLFSFVRTLQIALTNQIARTGLRPREAALIAAAFTDFGEGPLPDTPAREPGKLFEEGLTVLAWYPGEAAGRVMNVRPERTLLHDLLWYELPRETVSAIVVNRIYQSVRAGLGLA
ncbi:hypothetical protein [Roseomonas sp. KE0001]|uniref:hypothetical protein n=1 Tax=Roseomonas sp. KE0001 TaxID=2479201 RepID=UPI0018DF7FD3|nr:hypothetical protein [Roseomonas sp. KE0001]MBI0432812.1 hypothetical protein [Roseomonas sp. KE0001]